MVAVRLVVVVVYCLTFLHKYIQVVGGKHTIAGGKLLDTKDTSAFRLRLFDELKYCWARSFR